MEGLDWIDLLRIGKSGRAVDNRVMKLGFHKMHAVS